MIGRNGRAVMAMVLVTSGCSPFADGAVRNCSEAKFAVVSAVTDHWSEREALSAVQQLSGGVAVRVSTRGVISYVNAQAMGQWMYVCMRIPSTSPKCRQEPADSARPTEAHRRAAKAFLRVANDLQVPKRATENYRQFCAKEPKPLEVDVTRMVLGEPTWYVSYLARSNDGGVTWSYQPAYAWTVEPTDTAGLGRAPALP